MRQQLQPLSLELRGEGGLWLRAVSSWGRSRRGRLQGGGGGTQSAREITPFSPAGVPRLPIPLHCASGPRAAAVRRRPWPR